MFMDAASGCQQCREVARMRREMACYKKDAERGQMHQRRQLLLLPSTTRRSLSASRERSCTQVSSEIFLLSKRGVTHSKSIMSPQR